MKKPDVITLDMYFTDFITKKDRRKEYPNDFTPEILANAKKLLVQINAILIDLGIEKAQVSSGWRPEAINNKTTNAAKKSYHMLGLAIDILDNKNQDLSKLVASKPDLLKKYNLWLEDSASTKGKNTNWCHMDLGTRSDRPVRIFKP